MKRLRTRLTGMALACAGLVAAPPAQADPGTFAVVLANFMAIETAVAITVALYTYGAYALAAYAVHGSIQARNKAKRAAAAARNAYNAGLQDRNVTALTAAPGRRVVYGRCDTGGDLVAMFTTDKMAHDLDEFRAGIRFKADAYKHLIVVWAAHPCAAIHDLKIDGIPVGTLDSQGWATGDEWRKSDPRPTAYGQQPGNELTRTLPAGSTVISVTLLSGADGRTHTPIAAGAGGYSMAGNLLTLPGVVSVGGFAYTPAAGDTWDISYSADDLDGMSALRVRHHLGAPDQAADAELMALLPGKWTADHRLRGRCYSWLTLDLERAQFQGGPPGITADISGALLLDPRTGQTAWSDNPALCAYDYLRRIEGMAVSSAEIDTASVVAAANDCDVPTSFTVGGSTSVAPRYTCNGLFVAGAAKEAVLIDICEAMAGFHTYSGQWRILAGSWTPPVMDLTDADLHGSLSVVQAGEPSGELFNTVRGQYVPARSAVPADLETYSNPTFVAADGRALVTDLELPFTNSRARAKNIARIKVEQSRAGEVIFFPAKLRAWPLQTGDRVRVTSAEYGFSAKMFRVTDWQFGLHSPVGLTLQEDGPDLYDEADAALADPNPNTDLPSPWVVAPLASASAASGTAQLQRLGDGTVISRVLVSWPRSTAAYMQGGRIEVQWREAGSNVLHQASTEGTETQLYLSGVRDGAQLTLQVTAINTQGARSAPVRLAHFVQGKTAAPAAVAGLAATLISGGVRLSWTPCAELDYGRTVLRHGSSWAAGTPLKLDGPASSYDWLWPPAGTYTFWAAHVDTTGNFGPPVSVGPVVVTEAATADAAYAAAMAAQDTADEAAGLLAIMRRNDRLDAGEKPAVIRAWQALSDEFSALQAQADSYGITTEKTAYISAINALASYLGGLSPAWNNAATDTPIDPATDLARWSDAYYKRQLLLNKIADEAGKRANWGTVTGRPKAFKVGAVGGSASPPSGFSLGVRNAETDAQIGDAVRRSHLVVELNRSGELVFSTTYDVYGIGENLSPDGVGRTGADLAAKLNEICDNRKGNIVVVVSHDEPARYRVSNGLPEAMYRCGASRAVFGSEAFKSRSAYILVGIAGCGEGNGAEVYAGEADNSANAWCELAFDILNGQLRVSGTTSGAKTLLDFGYTGDLAATRNTLYRQATPPAYEAGALWYDTDDGNKPYIAEGGSWVAVRDAGIGDALAAAAAAQATADGKIELFYQPSAPAGADGDLWFDTDDGNRQYVRVAGSWTLAADTRIGTALDAAAGAQATADGKVTTFFAASAPTAGATGDLWFNTSDGRVKRWSGSAWVTQSVIGSGDVGTGNLATSAATEVAQVTFATIAVSNAA